MSKNTERKQGILTFIAECNNGLSKRFAKIGYLPRWIIMCIDMLLVCLSCYITFQLVANLTWEFYETYPKALRYGLLLAVYAFSFLGFRTYAGIIRHSSFVDAIKLFTATATAVMILVACNYSHYFIFGTKIYLFPFLVVHFAIAFLALLSFRVTVKYIFEHYLSGVLGPKEKVVIYGADANAIALANALLVEQPKRFKPVGFTAKGKSKVLKQVLGLPIVPHKKNVAGVLRQLKASAIIISDTHLEPKEKLRIVEDCLEHGFKVMTVPSMMDWEDRARIAKSVKQFDINDLLERQPIVLENEVLAAQLRNKVLLVTGAAGSIGSEIVRQLMEYGADTIIILDQAETPLHELTLELQKRKTNALVVPIVADIRDRIILQEVFATYQPNAVYHAAAYKHVPLMEGNPYQAVMNNVMGTKYLADLAVAYQVERFVMVSTDKAVNPSNIMGASKRIAELYVQQLCQAQAQTATTKFITTRFGNVLGSNGSVVPLFSKQIAEGGPITITHPDIIRYFMTIPEACQLVLEAGAMGNGGEIYIFDMGKPVRILDLAKKMILLAGYVPEKDIAIQISGLRPGEKLYEELLNDTATTLPTHHEKIMIATDTTNWDWNALQEMLTDLENMALANQTEAMVRQMKNLVPEFKSLNSAFAALDA